MTTKEKIIRHVGKFWKQYAALFLCAGIALSGFSVKTDYFSCNKTVPSLPKSKSPNADVQK